MSQTNPPPLIWSAAARLDLIRLRQFIEPHNPMAACRAATKLKEAAEMLRDFPGIGKRVEGRSDRELGVPFGKHGYVIRYTLLDDAIVILRLWHELEDRR
jgi:plasmid stabilization system protein ParE